MLKKLWNMVNRAETRQAVNDAEKAIKEADINNDDYDELMMALSYISRELYHRR